jgi:hypothetical protein
MVASKRLTERAPFVDHAMPKPTTKRERDIGSVTHDAKTKSTMLLCASITQHSVCLLISTGSSTCAA